MDKKQRARVPLIPGTVNRIPMTQEDQQRLLTTIDALRSPNKAGIDSLELLRQLRGYPSGS
jgi:hypothetical protein